MQDKTHIFDTEFQIFGECTYNLENHCNLMNGCGPKSLVDFICSTVADILLKIIFKFELI